MRVILSSGFRDSRILNLEQSALVDKKIVDDKNKKYRQFAVQYLTKEYDSIKKSVEAKNKKLKKDGQDVIVLPKFDAVEFAKTGNLSREMYQLLEYGDPFRMVEPRQIVTKLRKLVENF